MPQLQSLKIEVVTYTSDFRGSVSDLSAVLPNVLLLKNLRTLIFTNVRDNSDIFGMFSRETRVLAYDTLMAVFNTLTTLEKFSVEFFGAPWLDVSDNSLETTNEAIDAVISAIPVSLQEFTWFTRFIAVCDASTGTKIVVHQNM